MHELVLSRPELELLLELLERDQKELLVEIRHTDTTNFRVGLRERLTTIESMIRLARAALDTSVT